MACVQNGTQSKSRSPETTEIRDYIPSEYFVRTILAQTYGVLGL